ncbi:MAG TPA: AAA family ATPase [Vicinamibacterales bacterium]|jgi:putative secretion ATPase (PEP-CTERM system associated)
MYERFYNLRERPFSLSPDPDYLYPSRVHSEALSYLRYGIEGHAGFVVITGEIGSGKTTLLQTTLRGIDRRTSVARLVSTMLDARELLEAVMLDFGLAPPAGASKPVLLRELARFLVEQRKAGRLALLIIDEAQNLSLSALEEVRMLSNLETEKSKLIQIVLIGQPNLQDLLSKPELEQLRQRVTVRYHLRALDPRETAAYINHRLRKASIGAPLVFPHDVTDLIEQASQGLPRQINVIADAVLLSGYGDGKAIIDVALVSEVIAELESSGVIQRPQTSRSAPVPSPVMEPVDPLAEREAQIALRERQLAEQHRIVAQQYRIIRELELAMSAPTRPSTPPPEPAAPTRTESVPTPSPATSTYRQSELLSTTFRGVNEAPARSEGAKVTPPPPDRFWTRVKRGLFGSAMPTTTEDPVTGESYVKGI